MKRRSESLSNLRLYFVFTAFFVCGLSRAGTQNASDKLRDPFWPVGYVPVSASKPVAAEVGDEQVTVGGSDEADWDAALGKVQMAGVSRKGDTTVVIVNGQVRNMGSRVSVVYEGRTYTWRIDSVDEQGLLTLKRVGLQ